MSRPQYMREMHQETKSPSSIIVTAETITTYIFTITKNENQFPKALRYSLISELQRCCLKICKHVYSGNAKKPQTKEDFEHVEKCQKKTYNQMMNLKALISASMKIAHLNNFEHLAMLYVNLTDAYKRWIHNTRRAKGRAKHSGIYTKKERAKAFTENRLRNIASSMTKDAEGFVLLVPRINENC